VVESKANRRYLLQNGQLRSPYSLSLLPALLKDLLSPRGDLEDESIFSFACRRFGREVAATHLDPLVSGIYGGDPKKLSLKACFPTLHHLEKTYRSCFLGMPFLKTSRSRYRSSLISFKSGMETLIHALSNRLESNLYLNVDVIDMDCENGTIGLKLNGKKQYFDAVFWTAPLAPLQKIGLPYSPCSNSLSVVNLGYRNKVLSKRGFGYLVPRKEGEKILGVVFDSEVFPDQNSSFSQTRLTVMMPWQEGAKEIALEAIQRHLGIDAIPDVVEVVEAKEAIAQYEVGHLAKAKLNKKFANKLSPHLYLLGSKMDGVAVNDCVAIAKNISSKLHL
jgi:oxygen-dependent protoporphyrinogen oxidase